MIIEFFGFPGSGKTTISNHLLLKLESTEHKPIRGTLDHLPLIRRLLLKSFYSILYLFVNPKLYLENLRFFLKYDFLNHFNDFVNITYLLCRYQIFKNSNKIAVFDQGLIQAYYSLSCFHDRYKDYNYGVIFKRTDFIIGLELDLEENKNRLRNREKQESRVEKVQESRYQDFMLHLIEIKTTLMEDLPGEKQLYLDGTKPINLNIEIICTEFL